MTFRILFTGIKHALQSMQGWCKQKIVITVTVDSAKIALNPAALTTSS